MLNLAVIESGQYLAQGSYGFSETGLRLPFECHFKVESFPNALVLEGRAQQHSGRPQYGVRCEISRDELSQSQAEVIIVIADLTRLSGRISLTGPTIELLAYDLPSNSALSARLVPLEKPRLYELSGFLSLHGLRWFPFHFRVVPTGTHEALANVVGIHARRPS